MTQTGTQQHQAERMAADWTRRLQSTPKTSRFESFDTFVARANGVGPTDAHPLSLDFDVSWRGPHKVSAFPQLHREKYIEAWPNDIKPQAVLECLRYRRQCIVCGKRGVGKTQLAAWCVRHVRMVGWPCITIYTTALDMFAYIKAMYAASSPHVEHNLRNFKRVPLLVIDEVQVRSDTTWEDNTLTNIVDARYGARLPTILITNVQSSQLTQTLGASIVSRVMEGGTVVELDWPSFRGAA